MSTDTPTIRWVEEFALSTDGWIKAFPLGEYKRNGRTLSITPEKVKRMEANFRNKVTDYDIPVNVEHLPEHGRVGVIADMQARDDGLWMLPNDEARSFLESKKFGYVSPEVVWNDYTNHQGVKADDVVVGLAATNTPFFGKNVALFSAKENFMMADGMESSAYYWLGLLDSLTRAVSGTESNDPARSALEAAKEAVKRKTTGLISEYSGGKMPDKSEEFAAGNAGLIETIGLWDKTLRAIRKYLPAEQAEEVEEAVEDAKDEAKRDEKDAKKDKASARQAGDVYNMNVTGVDKEQFAALQAQLTAQAEQFAAVKAENERLAQAVAAEQYRAELGVMDKYAARYTALSVPDKFSAHLLTWKTKLGEEEFSVLTETLRAANEAVKAGGLFSRRSHGEGVERNPAEAFEAKVKVKVYMAANSVSYGDAFNAVADAERELYAQATGRA
jgi:hypothetical protein